MQQAACSTTRPGAAVPRPAPTASRRASSTSSSGRAAQRGGSAPRRTSLAAAAAAAAAAPEAPTLPFRVGHGWDLHRLEAGYPLIVGGIDIPHDVGCVAHSDGDVLLHTVVDAILGALCLPDIGQLFPDTDPKWKGARSDIFLKEAVRLMRERGYTIGNIDCTIIAQRPKMAPHKGAIRDNLCQMLGAHPSVVNIKAKTHEKVDSLGENRSIACHAVVMLLRQ
ncbi:2-C-methyl-D-erythritol 2,4-cyclodiphosphate chloroplastic [Micractinium conductrix]|uniref:2-C-methyl-D-erythritol 2,4-cyclodiphosphate synthase n=1 Tax=Micractinium conductrix TaxID=554055 RepID=A0A2P6VCR1_9CHLO|nr:2-C-methyl-D-erythritol 2,4-cyclodiphosphate chloroplastic [Micractinium conductrix]|eukprot:PSC71886.1 2-C-methyl-D-erythritol 2,4-cyclodiphosphate chloroplastic [Micractinium conductrix]